MLHYANVSSQMTMLQSHIKDYHGFKQTVYCDMAVKRNGHSGRGGSLSAQ